MRRPWCHDSPKAPINAAVCARPTITGGESWHQHCCLHFGVAKVGHRQHKKHGDDQTELEKAGVKGLSVFRSFDVSADLENLRIFSTC